MKCQSDYDSEEQALVRQTDECVQEWWEGESHPTNDGAPKVGETKQPVNAAENEAFRRGLLKRDESGGLCLSCLEGDE
jgi:hypothetical protein